MIFILLSRFSTNFLCGNRIAPDGTPRFAASHLGLYCLPMSHKKDARLIRFKQTVYQGCLLACLSCGLPSQ